MTADSPPIGRAAVAPATSATRSSPLGRLVRRRELLLVVLTLVVFVVTDAVNSGFGQGGYISFMLADAMPLAILAVGQTIVCLVRGIDLSVATVLGVAAVATGFLAQDYGSSVWLMLPLALALGIGLGLINGLFVVFARIPPIIVTLGTLIVYLGIQQLICNTRTVVTVPTSYATFGNGNLVGDIPYMLVPGVVVTVIVAFALWRTTWGRALYAVGANAEAAFRAGIRVNWVLISAYTVCGMLAGLGGLAWLVHYDSADYTTGFATNINLYSIAAVLIGGTTLTGGKGGVVGSFIAALFLEVTIQAVVLLGIPEAWESAAVGILLLAAILVNRYQASGHSLFQALAGHLRGRPQLEHGSGPAQ
ncbi:MAG TPA: ABC transporter permease [Solirubrobacteraceae bacterium]|jgi:ribose/xylose/arabinose/galactoside ABC-type transport system permease subunit|nr:ABC transporter permease [Solirubrobacteraceae bacterium]